MLRVGRRVGCFKHFKVKVLEVKYIVTTCYNMLQHITQVTTHVTIHVHLSGRHFQKDLHEHPMPPMPYLICRVYHLGRVILREDPRKVTAAKASDERAKSRSFSPSLRLNSGAFLVQPLDAKE